MVISEIRLLKYLLVGDYKLVGKSVHEKIFVLLLISVLTLAFNMRLGYVYSSSNLSSDGTLVYVNPEKITGNLNDIFTIDIVVFNVTDLYGVDILFSWDPTILEYVSHTAKIPMEDYPDGILHEPGFIIKDDVDVTEGTYWLAYASMSPAEPFNGTGIAFNMTFRIVSLSGACILDIVEAALSDGGGNPIAVEIKDGLFTPTGAPIARFSWWPEIGVVEKPVIFNASESYDPDGSIVSYFWDFGDGYAMSTTNPVIAHTFNHTLISKTYTVSLIVEDDSGTNSSKTTHSVAIVKSRNIAVQNVELTPTFITMVGSNITINVTVENKGYAEEIFTLAIYYNTSSTSWTLIDARNFTLKGAYRFTFEWNTAGVEPEKYYVIKANTTAVPYEENLTDNTIFSDPIFITTIEIHDLAIKNLDVKPCYWGRTFWPPVILGENVTFAVAIVNNGSVFEQNFIVTLHANNSLIKNWKFSEGISPGAAIWLTFEWDDISKVGIYDIVASVFVADDINLTNNYFQTQMQVIAPPLLNITCTPLNPHLNENVTLDASNSIHRDPQGVILDYAWALYEPGTTPGIDSPTARLNGINVSYNFTKQGDWTIVLTVKDNYNMMYNVRRPLTANYAIQLTVNVMSIIGDVNGDSKVTIEDVVLAASQFMLTPDDPTYDPTIVEMADIAPLYNGIIDIFDLITIIAHYGETRP